MTTATQFPPQRSIIAYLNQHPLTNPKMTPVFTEWKIIEAVAEKFGFPKNIPVTNKNLERIITSHIPSTTDRTKLDLSGYVALLKTALTDCKNRKYFHITPDYSSEAKSEEKE